MKIKHYLLIEPNLPSTRLAPKDEHVSSGGWWANSLKPAVRRVLRQALATIQMKGLANRMMDEIPSNNELSAMDATCLDNHWDGSLDPFCDRY